MTMPVEHSWNVRLSARNDRGWFSFNAVATTYVAAILDFAVLFFASAGGYMLYEQVLLGMDGDLSRYAGVGLLVSTVFVLALGGAHAYRPAGLLSFRRQMAIICTFLPAVVAFLLAIVFFLKIGTMVSRGAILSAAVLSFGALTTLRLAWYSYLNRAVAHASFPTRRVLLICPDSTPVEPLIHKAALGGLSIKHTMHLRGADEAPSLLQEKLQKNGIADVDEVLIVWGDYANAAVLEECLSALREFCVPVSVMFSGLVGDIAQGFAQDIGENRAFQIHRPPLGLVERMMKRLFDIGFSIGAMTVTLPLCVLVAIAIKIDSRGPVFFMQCRKGHNGKPFRILKFRSMTVMEDSGDIRQATRNDPRVTRVGAFIRSTSIDELPQFWNVLRGEMSVVGPRPHALAHDDLYGTLIAQYASRRHVKPGLTGWAQINGHRGETPTVDKMTDRVRHDIWYINNWSLWLDLRIVVMTAIGLQDRSNVY
ncbi:MULTISPECIES: exopolysaccharide biosynthesis polyprenyl glycosylphosphotransferase [unclassified Rhizobium]|uniref:exopolysaccharide biosynthesis polyprenyl glycosylphosphotransferase n=1 Tax=unclassified Rhizobium TaxID=2613769 RepID=UPI001AD98A55|nr:MULTISPECIES: exopolysaccharide biosynthesis polyprenyl glycosylphosphotransferase [unclassified Rhizobium]MBO9127246.1 exopolysaccharide biosynthesis polyprenyl glycosylphosphotransferase [Rhizobium sp. 16-488-2b]MBO9177689.1 exopolysaccharide biosynthesis polyprenyl glycosylphosphotransferase [Rhizobium sp. 16-488-2a]